MLGGDTIHIFVENSKVKTRRCRAPDADAHAASIISNATEQTEIVNYSLRHASCVHHESSWYGGVLRFLRTHKSFHKNAKAMPFALNTFIFASCSEFIKFKNMLQPFQRDNLASIVVNCVQLRPWSPFGRVFVPTEPLRGLENLTIFYEAEEKYNPNLSLHTYVQSTRNRLDQFLDEFHGGKIRNVDVCVTTTNRDDAVAEPGLFGAVNAELKAKVLAANPVA